MDRKLRKIAGEISAPFLIPDTEDVMWLEKKYNVFYDSAAEQKSLEQTFVFQGRRNEVQKELECTVFPSPLLRGAGFNPHLEEKIGNTTGTEIIENGGNLYIGLCPETMVSENCYSTDYCHTTRMCQSMARGINKESVLVGILASTGKKSLSKNAKKIVRNCMEGGKLAIYAMYKDKEKLLEWKKLLKEHCGFEGPFIGNMFEGWNSIGEALTFGIDAVINNDPYWNKQLAEDVEAGKISDELLRQAEQRIDRVMINKNTLKLPHQGSRSYKKSGELAKESAEEGITLLKNEREILPLCADNMDCISVIGTMGNSEKICGNMPPHVYPSSLTTIFKGIAQIARGTRVIYYNGENISHAEELAAKSDAVILALERCKTSPDKKAGLNEESQILIEHVGNINPHTIAVVFGDGILVTTPWIQKIPAVFYAFYPGMEGGAAIASLLFGRVNPSGKLPFKMPDFPFGYGKSYTTFRIKCIYSEKKKKSVIVKFIVQNTGQRTGAEVVQGYRERDGTMNLFHYEKVVLEPGAEKEIIFLAERQEKGEKLYIGNSADRRSLYFIEID